MIKKCQNHGFFRGDACACGETGTLMLNDEQTERLGRFISGALRHFPDDLGLAMNQHGWVGVDVLVDAMITRYKWSNKEKLFSIIESDEKGRYEIKETRSGRDMVIPWMWTLIMMRISCLNCIMGQAGKKLISFLKKE